jgi:hypothetical protein
MTVSVGAAPAGGPDGPACACSEPVVGIDCVAETGGGTVFADGGVAETGGGAFGGVALADGVAETGDGAETTGGAFGGVADAPAGGAETAGGAFDGVALAGGGVADAAPGGDGGDGGALTAGGGPADGALSARGAASPTRDPVRTELGVRSLIPVSRSPAARTAPARPVRSHLPSH